MKVKYYMRGLGIGIILTTLIFTISNYSNKLTDQEIIERATKLGMVSKEERNEKLEDIIKSTEAPATVPTITPTEVPAEPTAEPTETPAPEPTLTPTEAPVQGAVNSDSANDPETAEITKEIGFTIIKGMSSSQVANLLVDVGLIEDADDFNNYIKEVGKASIISVGDFDISENATYEEIVKAITTK